MSVKHFRLLLITNLVFLGCAAEPDFVATPEKLVGVVDESLPPAQQAKQQSVRRFLKAIQEGVGDAEQLRLVAPGIRYSGSFTGILQGHARLARWEFTDAMQGNRVPVKLFFDELQGGPIDPRQLTQSETAFVVSGSGNSVLIADAPK